MLLLITAIKWHHFCQQYSHERSRYCCMPFVLLCVFLINWWHWVYALWHAPFPLCWNLQQRRREKYYLPLLLWTCPYSHMKKRHQDGAWVYTALHINSDSAGHTKIHTAILFVVSLPIYFPLWATPIQIFPLWHCSVAARRFCMGV